MNQPVPKPRPATKPERAWNASLPARTARLVAKAQIARSPFRSRVPQSVPTGSRRNALSRSKGVPKQSDKGRKEQTERSKVLRAMFPAHEWHGCSVPGCGAEANDAHEPKLRSRGGSAVDPENIRGVCRQHHNWVHENPYAAEQLGMMRHSWE